jgi:hypothetical protein
MTTSATARLVLGLALACSGCASVVEATADEDPTTDEGADDERPLQDEPDPSFTGPVEDGGELDGDDDDAFGELSDGGESSDGGETSGDTGSVAPVDDPCVEVADCVMGRPFAVEPCSAELDVSPSQCGYLPVCTRQIAWRDAADLPIAPPPVIEVGYLHAGDSDYTAVGHACYAPEDALACVVPCDGVPVGAVPVDMMRVTYTCVGAMGPRTTVLKGDELAVPIVLRC